MIIDASNLILGRMASFAAKKALSGEEIIVINCEKAVITGRKNSILARYRLLMDIGQPTKGPFIPRRPDLLVRRVIRGMLPRKRARGREAYKKVKCYMEMPPEIKQDSVQTISSADINSRSTSKYVTVKELCRLIRK
ncbi:50S ribosomal protein L13 [Candidatus Woesearchaeota archaeon]|nr:50S ribosomal protein L13 [Candidatus Woesearchaeota archaeon]